MDETLKKFIIGIVLCLVVLGYCIGYIAASWKVDKEWNSWKEQNDKYIKETCVCVQPQIEPINYYGGTYNGIPG